MIAGKIEAFQFYSYILYSKFIIGGQNLIILQQIPVNILFSLKNEKKTFHDAEHMLFYSRRLAPSSIIFKCMLKKYECVVSFRQIWPDMLNTSQEHKFTDEYVTIQINNFICYKIHENKFMEQRYPLFKLIQYIMNVLPRLIKKKLKNKKIRMQNYDFSVFFLTSHLHFIMLTTWCALWFLFLFIILII